MKNILVLLCMAGIINSCGSSKSIDMMSQSLKIVEKSNAIKMPKSSPVQLALDVQYLASDELKGRNTGSEGIEKAAIYLSERFSDMGVPPYGKTYMDHFEVQGKKAFNVVGLIVGSDKKMMKEVVVIGAHYDHIGMLQAVAGDSIANGANDNATGTAAVLAIVENFRKLDFNKRTVVFALFSAEEKGLLGSKNLAKRMKREGMNVVAMINFEMIGTPMNDHPYIAYLTGYDGSNMAAVFNKENKELIVTGKLEQAVKYNLFMRSDNHPFFEEFNVPSQTFSSFDFTNFDHYHKVGDDISQVNTQHMARVVDAVMPGVFKVVNGDKLKLTPVTYE